MRQLVQLQQQANEFKALNAEMIFIFREEADGPAGLKKIEEKTKTTFTLALDLNRASTGMYSSGKRVFDNYVIDKLGTIRAIIPGTLKTRATAEQLIKHLKEIEAE